MNRKKKANLEQNFVNQEKGCNFARMKRIFRYIMICVAAINLMGCHENIPAPAFVAERTVVVYMMAENSLYSFVNSDIEEMITASAEVPENMNYIIYLDSRKEPTIYTLTARKGLSTWKQYTEDMISTDSLVMLNTLSQIVTSFPAKAYDLVLWSHGSGWIPQSRSIGIDNGENTSSNTGIEMNITTLRGVLEHLPHWEMVMFDACLMQSIEVAYELKDVTDYMVGSPTETNAYGAPYDKIMKHLLQGDAENVARAYYESYENGPGAAISAVDCRQLDNLGEVMKALVPKIWGGKKEIDTKGIQYYSPFGSSSRYRPEPYDIEGVMYHTLEAEDFTLWKEAWGKVNVFCAATDEWASVYGSDIYNHLIDREHYSGMSMFVPDEKYAPYQWMDKFREFRWYKAAGWDETGW